MYVNYVFDGSCNGMSFDHHRATARANADFLSIGISIIASDNPNMLLNVYQLIFDTSASILLYYITSWGVQAVCGFVLVSRPASQAQ